MFDEEKNNEKRINKMIREAIDFRQATRDNEYIVNMAHYEGLHWNLAENKSESPFLLKSDINHLKNAIDLRLGSLFSESYFGTLEPLSPNDIENIDILNNLYKNEWSRLNADDRVEAAIKNACIQDNGYTEINFDEGAIFGGTGTRREGSITLKDLSTSDVYLDPKADSIDECEYIVVKSRKTKNWIKRHKPEWLSKLESKDIKPASILDNEDGNLYTGRDYGQSTSNLYSISTVYEKYTTDMEIETQDKNGDAVVDPDGNPVMESVNVSAIRIHYIIEDKLIETNEEYPFDEFPIIPMQWQPEPQSPYGIPLVRGLTIPQKVANLIESAANNIAMHYTIPSWLVSEESGLDINKVAKLSSALGVVWKVSGDVSRAMKQLEYPAVDEQLISIKESFVANIQTYSGVTPQYIGNIGTSGSTAEGTNLAVSRATVIDNEPIKQIEKYVEKLSRMIIKFMTRYYRGQTIYIRDTKKQKDGAYTFKDFFIGDNLENINYDFTVKLSSRSKSDKNRQYNLLKDLYQLQNQYRDPNKVINVPDLVKAAQLENYDEMFKRFSDMSEEAFQEKADMIVQIMNIGGTITPNGTPLIPAELMQQGIIDVLNDDGDLSTVENIFKTYEDYQTQLTQMMNQMDAQEQQRRINDVNNQQQMLQQQMEQGVTNMNQENDMSQRLDELGL